MKSFILLAGAAALGISAPASAQDHGHGNHNDRDHSDRYDNNRHDNGHHYGNSRGHHRYAQGQRYQRGYGTYYSYSRIPYNVRHHYRLNRNYRYYYDNGYYYGVDPTTMIVQQVISGLLR